MSRRRRPTTAIALRRDPSTVVELRRQVPPASSRSARTRAPALAVVAVDGLAQLAYEIEASRCRTSSAIAATTGVVGVADQVGVRGARASRCAAARSATIRVRVGRAMAGPPWSPVATASRRGCSTPATGRLAAITLPDDPGRERAGALAPAAPRVRGRRRRSPARGCTSRRSALHEVTVNGDPVADDLLAPGWTTYDAPAARPTPTTSRACSGRVRNAIAAALGDGWYRGPARLGPAATTAATTGARSALIAQLEVELADGTRAADRHRRAPGARRPARSARADLYDGCVDRPRGCGAPGWDRPGLRRLRRGRRRAVVPFDPRVIEPRVAPPVRVVAVLAGRRASARPGRRRPARRRPEHRRASCGSASAASAGDRVTVRHAEVLEPDGSLHTRSLRSAKATDTLHRSPTTRDGRSSRRSRSTASGTPRSRRRRGRSTPRFVAISSDTPPRGSFACSDAGLDAAPRERRLVAAGQLRLGPDRLPAARRAARLDRRRPGVRADRLHAVRRPRPSGRAGCATSRSTRTTAWACPAVVPERGRRRRRPVRPGRLGRRGDDRAVGGATSRTATPTSCARSSPSMRRWVDSLVARAATDGLLGRRSSSATGSTLTPRSDRPWEAKADSDFLANAFFAHSARLWPARGRSGARRRASGAGCARPRATRSAGRTWARWRDARASTTQTGCALALRFGIAPDAERAERRRARSRGWSARPTAGWRPASSARRWCCPRCADAGHFDEAYRMLLRRRARRRGCTRSTRARPRSGSAGTPSCPTARSTPGRMATPPNAGPRATSAHALVQPLRLRRGIDWVYRNVAGLAPDRPARLPARRLRASARRRDQAMPRHRWTRRMAGRDRLRVATTCSASRSRRRSGRLERSTVATDASIVTVDGGPSDARVEVGPAVTSSSSVAPMSPIPPRLGRRGRPCRRRGGRLTRMRRRFRPGARSARGS